MRITVYIILTAMCLSLVSQKAVAQNDSVKIGFILANLFVERWQKDKSFFEARVTELGGKVIFKDCYDQPDNQLVAAKELIAEDVDAIVIIAIDAVAAAPIVTYAKEANIPVIAYDRLILNAPLDYYITFNSVTVGELMANTVVNKISSGNILYLGGPSDDHNSLLIRKGAFKVLNPVKDNYTIFSTQVSSWTELDAYLKVQDYVSNKGTTPDAIICAADILTRGAIGVLEENNVFGKVVITGQDAELDICKHVANDLVDLTIYKPGKVLAERAADEIWKILENSDYSLPEKTNNGLIDVPSILLTPIPVTKETLEETVIKDECYSSDQIFKKKIKNKN